MILLADHTDASVCVKETMSICQSRVFILTLGLRLPLGLKLDILFVCLY